MDPFFNYETTRTFFEGIPLFLRVPYTLRYGLRDSYRKIGETLGVSPKEIKIRIDYMRKTQVRTKKRHQKIMKYIELLLMDARARTRDFCRRSEERIRMLEERSKLDGCFRGFEDMDPALPPHAVDHAMHVYTHALLHNTDFQEEYQRDEETSPPPVKGSNVFFL